ncbi:MAG: RnfABCDGE type electron transport complex subunit G [Bacillota bacterium]|nr:MAG: RnfABCDGE type electron transport complex subunit G [Bacillota bacterium]
MRDILKLSLTLALICAVAGGAIAATNSVTSNIILERQQQELTRALGELLPDADQFEEVNEEGVAYYVGTKAGKAVGAIMVSAGNGYAGPVNVLVSITMSGEIRTVRVSGHRETVGIGDKVENTQFLGQFVNKTPADKVTIGQDITAVSGATISSRAVAAGVKLALANFQVHLMGVIAPTDDFDPSKIKDGIYNGEALGYKSPITVEVTISEGRITKISVTHKDTPELADDAVDIVAQRIVDKQHYQVDVVSGATFTSEGLIEAITNALAAAPLK